MTEYNIKQVSETFYVVNATENFVIGTSYNTEAKAKRRIRDLKRKELEAGVHGNLVVPNSEADLAMIAIDAAWPNNFEAIQYDKAFEHHTKEVPVGVYPAISKHQHQRRAYGKSNVSKRQREINNYF